MFIQTSVTPNPASLMFLPGEKVMEVGPSHIPHAYYAGSALGKQMKFCALPRDDPCMHSDLQSVCTYLQATSTCMCLLELLLGKMGITLCSMRKTAHGLTILSHQSARYQLQGPFCAAEWIQEL